MFTLQALRAQDQQLWVSNNRLMGLGQPTSSQQGNINDWSSPLSLNLQPIYSNMAQQ